jgi:predicted amidohydrolase YtcJ
LLPNLIYSRIAFALVVQFAIGIATPAFAENKDQITVYTAKKIVTMDSSRPTATAVAVRDGRILAVGTQEKMKPWLERFPHKIDKSFDNKILVPGFIAVHEHPLLAAMTITRRPLLAYYPTPNPYGPDIKGVSNAEEALSRLKAFVDRDPSSTDTVFAWGYDSIAMGGHLSKADLDVISKIRPIVIWDASVHFAYANTAFLESRDITVKTASEVPGIELGKDGQPNGQFLAVAAATFALRPEMGKLFADIKPLMDQVVALNKQAGITTTTELALGKANREFEEKLIPEYFNDDRIPLRIIVVPDAVTYSKEYKDKVVDAVKALSKRNTDKVYFSGVKFFADDAFLGLAMALRPPGYIDPKLKGIWNTAPDQLYSEMEPWWKAGLRLHIHSNGDASQDAVLDALAELQANYPRLDHRFVFEHFGISTLDQIRRLKTLGAVASVNSSYLYLRAELNAKYIGEDRAELSAPLGTLSRQGVPTAIHSDLPVAPADPLLMMWTAVNRFGQSGKVLGPGERVSVEQALKMVTLDSAYVLGMDSKIGSIEPGKFADFTVLESDPLTHPSKTLRDIKVWGTVFSGVKYPAPPKQPKQ